MKKIITAFANPELNEKISKEKEYNIIAPDIQYQEGVIEILEENKNIDVLILNSILPGEINIYKFINKIKEINNNLEIIIILEKTDEEINNFLFSKGITHIFYNNEITVEELIKLLKKEKTIIPEEINEEIKLLKEMILNNNIKNKHSKIYGDATKHIYNELINNIFKANKKIIKILKLNKINKLIIKNKINKKIKNKNNLIKIITIVGYSGAGKSVFSSIFSKIINNKKTLLIDFDIINNNISTIFGIKKIPKNLNEKINKNKLNNNKIKIEELIIKINNKLDLICGMELLFNNNKNIIKILKEISLKYNLIIIDTNSEYDNIYLKEIMQISDRNILLVEPNLLGIKKSKKILEIYINKWQLNKEKINIIFNKITFNSINISILKKLFSDFNILGGIKLNNKYDLLINNNLKIKDKKIKKEYLKIINKLNIKEEIKNGYKFIGNK